MNKANESLRYTLNPDSESYSVSGMGTCTDKDVVNVAVYSENGEDQITVLVVDVNNDYTKW